MIARLRALFTPPPATVRERLDVLDAIQASQLDGGWQITAPVVKFSGTEPFPTREEALARLAAAEILAEERWMALERAKEAEAINARQPKVRRMPIREVK